MRELRLADGETDALILETLDGEKFRLPVNDALKFAVRTVGPKPAAQSLTPRDIQDLIRAGESIDSIVASTGADAHFVSSFALPVLDELEHMIASARAVRLTIPGDRFNDDSQVEFGALIDARLADNGATSATWTSKRFDAAKWHITLSFKLGDNYGGATWSFDPRRVELDPEDETAAALSILETNPGPLPKSKFSSEPPVAFRKTAATPEAPAVTATVTELKPKTEKAVTEPKIVESAPPVVIEQKVAIEAVEEPDTPVEPTVSKVEVIANVTTLIPAQLDEPELDVDYPETINLVVDEPLEEAFVDDAPETLDAAPVAVDEKPEAVAPEPETSVAVDEKVAPLESAPTTDTGSISVTKKGRASMPSWDEIVFGTKSED